MNHEIIQSNKKGKRKIVKLTSLLIALFVFGLSYGQDCDEAVVPPTVIDGVTVTSSWTGSVTTYPTAWTSCGYTTPASSLHLGAAGAFTYTFNFSEPVNNVVFFITASGIPAAEEFTVSTDAGVPTIVDLGSCFTTIVGTTIFTGAGAGPTGGGGAFEVDNPGGPYTSFTLSGPGGMAGSLIALCSNSIEVEPSDVTVTPASCFGVCDGEATVVEGDDPPYTFLWDPGAGGGTAATATDLCAGAYTVEVTSASGAVEVLDVVIDEPTELTGSITAQTDVTCFGLADGTVSVEGAGGTGAYTFDIGAGPVASGDFTGLAAGAYTVTIEDENGCTVDVPVDIVEPAELTLTEVVVIDVLCNGDDDGEIEVIGGGGTAPYEYSIDGALFGPGAIFGTLTAGGYTLTVRDDNDCETTLDLVVNEPEPIVVEETTVDEVCEGDCNGTITLLGSGGTGAFTYSIDDCATSGPAGDFIDLCAAGYSICIEDENGCQYTSVLTINPGADAEDATIVPFGPLCIDAAPVVLDAATIGTFTGTGVVGGSFDPAVAGVGVHTITNTVVGGCGGIATFDIEVNPLPTVSFMANTTNGCEPLEVVFTNTGDIGTTCEWYLGDGSVSTSCGAITHTYEFAGTYDVSLVVIDLNGCSATAVYNDYIDVYEMPTANFVFDPSVTTTDETTITFTDLSSEADSWTWLFDNQGGSNDQNPVFTFPNVEGSYDITLIVNTDEGCVDSLTKTLIINQEQLIYVPNTITPDGDSFNEVFLPYFTGIDIYDYHLTIYNRWGEIIFESYDLTKGWSGTYGGEIVEDGVYIWHIVTADISTDEKLEFHGHVTVVK